MESVYEILREGWESLTPETPEPATTDSSEWETTDSSEWETTDSEWETTDSDGSSESETEDTAEHATTGTSQPAAPETSEPEATDSGHSADSESEDTAKHAATGTSQPAAPETSEPETTDSSESETTDSDDSDDSSESESENTPEPTETPESTNNPWFNVNNLLAPHRGQASDGLFQTWPQFTRLPSDLVPYIAHVLPKESAAALAVTSRSMYNIIGPRVFDGLNRVQKWKLILLLERDGDTMMACAQCNKLHVPIFGTYHRPTLFGAESFGEGPKCYKDPSYSTLHLPRSITPVLCRLLAKRYLRQQPYADILSMAAKSSSLILPDLKVFSNISARFVNGNLLVRNQIFIAPMTKGAKSASGRAMYALNKVMRKKTTLLGDFRCCQHLAWKDLGLDIPHSSEDQWDDTDFYKTEAFATGHSDEHHEGVRLWRAESHPVVCYGPEPVDEEAFEEAISPTLKCALLHQQPCMACKAIGTVNLVNSCSECYTDVCISAQDVQGIGRVMVLTNWKDLGGVRKDDNALEKWWSHSEVSSRTRTRTPIFSITPTPPPRLDITIAPRFEKERAGSIFAAYEGNTEPPAPSRNCNIRQSKMRKLQYVSRSIMHSGYSYDVTIGRRVTNIFKRDTNSFDERYWHRTLYSAT